MKTTVVCFLKRLDVNVEHMSGTVLGNAKGHGASSSRINSTLVLYPVTLA